MTERTVQPETFIIDNRKDGYTVTQNPASTSGFVDRGGFILVGHDEILSRLAQDRGITIEQAAIVIAEAHLS